MGDTFNQNAGNSQGGAFQQGHGNTQSVTHNYYGDQGGDAFTNIVEALDAMASEAGDPTPEALAIVDALEDGGNVAEILALPTDLTESGPVTMMAAMPENFADVVIPDYDDGTDHPVVLKAAVANIRERTEAGETVSDEEQQGLFSRMCSSLRKFATSEVTLGALELTAMGIAEMATLAPPLGIIKTVVGGYVRMVKK